MNNVSAYALRLGDNGLVLSQRLGALVRPRAGAGN